MTVNRSDGTSFAEVNQVGVSDGSTFSDAVVYKSDGTSWVQIWPSGGSTTTVDSYEDQDMAEYDFATSGSTTKSASSTFVTSDVTDGTYAVQLGDDANASNNVSFVSTSGLPAYFSQGETLAVDVTVANFANGEPWISYGSQGVYSGSARPYGYTLELRGRSGTPDDMRITVRDSAGNAAEVATSSTITWSNYDGVTLTAEIAWNTDDSHDITLKQQSDGTVIETLSATDSTWTSETGVGLNASLGASDGFPTFDHMRKL